MTDNISHHSNGDMRHFKPVSVYDYPEHLNPFYEDDNHKRLRFWRLNKSSKNGRGRSNSFSLSNLRDLWAFKTFRLYKKSSTLGINKTSESPPPLRKYNNQFLYDSNYNTYDPSCRQTISSVGSSTQDVEFQRNTPYRATLGPINTSARSYDTQSDIIFTRNEGYRNTIQNVTRGQRYNNASVTPVLGQKHPNGLSASQNSIGSTNPFEEDDNNENLSPNYIDETILENGGIVKTPARRRYRKKRPAPPPPVVNKTVLRLQEEPGASDQVSVELKIVEDETPTKDELPTISSLTAEIETLLKGVEEDVIEVNKLHPASCEETTPIKPERIARVKEVKFDDEQKEIKLTRVETVRVEVKPTNAEIVHIDDGQDSEKEDTFINKENVVVYQSSHPIVESPPIDNSNVETIIVTKQTIDVVPKQEEADKSEDEVEILTKTITKTKAIKMKIHEEKEIVEDLSISSEDQVSVTSSQPEPQLLIVKQTSLDAEHTEPLTIVEPNQPRRQSDSTVFEIKYVQLKDADDQCFKRKRSLREKEAMRKDFMRRALNIDYQHSLELRQKMDEEFERHNHSNSKAIEASNAEKKRSVKEIIESINRNQSMLQATNYTPLNGKYSYETDNLRTSNNINPQIQEEDVLDESLMEVELRPKDRGSYYDNVPDMLERLETQSENFEKCKSPRKSKPIYEWNPVPKPRRSRNFSEERDPPPSHY